MRPAPRRRNSLAALALAAAVAACAHAHAPAEPEHEKAPLFVPYPEAEVASLRSPHAYKGKPLCQGCHRTGERTLLAEANDLCQKCHRFGHSNHPVRVVQKTPARDLPLVDGKVACHTCHDPHDVKARKAGLRMQADELCMRCHPRH